MHPTAPVHPATAVDALSLGAAALGNLFHAVSDEDAAATVEAAWACGIRAFDTAPHYGLGLSERRLGDALRTRPRAQFTLSTKVGRLLRARAGLPGDDLANGFAVPATQERVWDFSTRGVRASVEESLTRLGLDRVDTVYLHDPDGHEREAFDCAYPELERMRAEGMVGAIGVGMNQTAMPTRFVRDTDIDVVLLAGRYSLLDQALWPHCCRWRRNAECPCWSAGCSTQASSPIRSRARPSTTHRPRHTCSTARWLCARCARPSGFRCGQLPCSSRWAIRRSPVFCSGHAAPPR